MGQASAALGTTAGKHLPAVGGSHSLAEAVLLGALTLLGLIGTEHLHTPPEILIAVQLAPHYSTAGERNAFHPAVD